MSEAQPASAPPAQRARPLRIVAVGNSHISAVVKGHLDQPINERTLGPRMKFIQLIRPEFRPTLKGDKLNPGIAAELKDMQPDAILSLVAGNAHNVLGLLNHPTRFDFVLPSQPDLPLDETADVLPSGVVERQLEETLDGVAFRVMRALQKAAGNVPLLHLESPPPIPSEEYIAQTDTNFGDRIAEYGVAPLSLRYKLWRLHSALVEKFCRDSDIIFVPVPKEVQDENGLLAEPFWGNATHGNGSFGIALLRAALDRIAQRATGPGNVTAA